jgi:hemerythrin-like domain-containing protein
MTDENLVPRRGERLPADRWRQEHSEIDALLSAVESALGRSDAREAHARIDTLREVMDAHFRFEEALYFPLIEKLCPAQSTSVEGALQGHRTVREMLGELQASVARGDLGPSRERLSSLIDHVGLHEQLELGMIAALQQAGSR